MLTGIYGGIASMVILPLTNFVGIQQPLFIMMKSWFMATFYLSLKIFVIIMVIMILLEIYYKLRMIYKPKLSVSNCDRKL
jgi:hypothetical protein